MKRWKRFVRLMYSLLCSKLKGYHYTTVAQTTVSETIFVWFCYIKNIKPKQYLNNKPNVIKYMCFCKGKKSSTKVFQRTIISYNTIYFQAELNWNCNLCSRHEGLLKQNKQQRSITISINFSVRTELHASTLSQTQLQYRSVKYNTT